MGIPMRRLVPNDPTLGAVGCTPLVILDEISRGVDPRIRAWSQEYAEGGVMFCRKLEWDECAIDATKPDDVPEVFFVLGQYHRAKMEQAEKDIAEEWRQFALIDMGAGI